jgi:hypothetical protein
MQGNLTAFVRPFRPELDSVKYVFLYHTSCIRGAYMYQNFRTAGLHTLTMQLEGMSEPLAVIKL